MHFTSMHLYIVYAFYQRHSTSTINTPFHIILHFKLYFTNWQTSQVFSRWKLRSEEPLNSKSLRVKYDGETKVLIE